MNATNQHNILTQSRRSLARVVLGHATPADAPIMWWTWHLAMRNLERAGGWIPESELVQRRANPTNAGTLAALLREARQLGVLEHRKQPGPGGRLVWAVRIPPRPEAQR